MNRRGFFSMLPGLAGAAILPTKPKPEPMVCVLKLDENDLIATLKDALLFNKDGIRDALQAHIERRSS